MSMFAWIVVLVHGSHLEGQMQSRLNLNALVNLPLFKFQPYAIELFCTFDNELYFDTSSDYLTYQFSSCTEVCSSFS